MNRKATIRILIYVFVSSFVFVVGCNPFQLRKLNKANIFELEEGGEAIILDGIINSPSFDKFKVMYEENPNIKVVKIRNCDGSIDDETNLKLSKYLHDKGLNTHLLEDATIASGGTDFFLAGVKRTADKNFKIGVHSWSNMVHSATHYPEDHENHKPYIEYYEYIGFSPEMAKKFYFYTINSASTHDIHWMTTDEIEEYNVITD